MIRRLCGLCALLIAAHAVAPAYGADYVSVGPAGRLVGDGFFGMHVRWGASKTPWPAAQFGSWRVITAETEWRGLQPARSTWNFQSLDRAVELAEANGVDVLLTLGQTPAWAAARPDEVVPNGPGASSEPRDLADWERYLRTVVARYRGRIAYYELWNEPRFREVDPYRKIAGFTGTARQMVDMARIARRVLDELDPDAKLVGPAVDAGFSGLKRLRTWYAAGGGKVVDITAYHFYLRPPERMVALHRQLRELMAEFGLDRQPLWNTESGFLVQLDDVEVKPHYPGTDGAFAKVLTREELAAYVVRTHVLLAAAGVERFYWYAWDIRNMGLTDKIGTVPTLASTAYVTTLRWLRNSVVKYCRTDDDVVWTCVLERGGQRAMLVWRVDGPPEDWRPPHGFVPVQYETISGEVVGLTDARIRVGVAPLLLLETKRAWYGG